MSDGSGGHAGAGSAPAKAESRSRLHLYLELVGAAIALGGLALGIHNCSQQAEVRARLDDAELSSRLGQAEEHLQRGEAEAARRDLEVARSYRPHDDELAILDAQHAVLTGAGVDRAIEILEQAVEAEPESAAVHFYLGHYRLEAGRPDAARDLERALELAGDDASGVGRAVVLINLGDAHFAQGDREKAKVAFQQALEADEDSPDAHARMGQVYNAEGRYPEAQREYERAAAADPENLEHLFGAANAAFYAEAYAETERLMRRYLERRESVDALRLLVVALDLQGKDSGELQQRIRHLLDGAR